MADTSCDVLIVGASLGGVAAALRAGAIGASVCLVEPSGWIGGQMTGQGVCTPDENQYVETVGSTASYRDFRRRVREFYRTTYRLSAEGAAMPRFNAGRCWVNEGFSVEPLVGQRILGEMLAEFGTISLVLNTAVAGVEMDGNAISAVNAVAQDGTATRFLAPFVLDATDTGDLLPLAGAEWTIGAESRTQTGEPDAPAQAHPEWVQPFTFPFALEKRPVGEDHTISQPPRYAQLKATQRYGIQDGPIRQVFSGAFPWWTYRRVIASENFAGPTFQHDIATINTGSNDYEGGVFPSGSLDTDAQTMAAGRLASLGYLYWLQTECPRDDDPARRGYPELKPRPDFFGTTDGLAPLPYIRESRRIEAQKTVRETDIAAKYNPGPRAALFPDTCGVGDYGIDIHSGSTGDPGLWEPTKPFQIPLGALLPIRVTNLIAACKNIGVTHITNGAYRVHPSEWAIGEAAGALAGFCSGQGVTTQAVVTDAGLLRSYQKLLLGVGIPLFWWSDIPYGHLAFVATQLLGVAQVFHGNGRDLAFDVDTVLTAGDAQALTARAGLTQSFPQPNMTRGAAAVWLAGQLNL